MYVVSKKGELAIEQPVFTKIETNIIGGFAKNSSRAEIIRAKLVMNYQSEHGLILAGSKILLRATAGLSSWAKLVYLLDDKEFVLCPESEIVGYECGRYDQMD